jgi:xanthine dehydrogenase accessory factor
MTRHTWFEDVQRLKQSGQAFAMVTVLRAQAPTSAKPGDKALVTADGQIRGWIGGGCAQPSVIRTVRQALADGQSRVIRIAAASTSEERQLEDVLEFGMTCHSGGTLELFIDPVLPAPKLVVFGDSAVARSLCDLAPRVGLDVALVAQGAQADDYPSALEVLPSDEPSSLQPHLNHAQLVVIATQGRRDMQALEAALALQAQHIWLVASHRKAGVLLQQLKSSGHAPQQVDRIVAPAGVPIGAKTPEEIALSVLATVVAGRRQVGQTEPVGARQANATAEPALATSAVGGSCCSLADGGDAPSEMTPVTTDASPNVGESASGWRGKWDSIAERFSNTPPSCCGGGR